jgi:LysR substrate binding domain
MSALPANGCTWSARPTIPWPDVGSHGLLICAIKAGSRFPEIPGRREISAQHVFALFLTHGLGEVAWTPVDSLTAQKRLVEAGLGIALLSQSNATEELRSSSISTIRVDNLSASQDIVAVTRRGGFLSAASKRLLEIIRADYAGSAVDDVVRPKRARTRERPFSRKKRQIRR